MGTEEKGTDEEQRKRCTTRFKIHCPQAESPFLILSKKNRFDSMYFSLSHQRDNTGEHAKIFEGL